jgi:hypothetical protein
MSRNHSKFHWIKLFLVLCLFCSCFSFATPVQATETSHGNKVEISDYDLKYTFYVPKEYEDNITKLTDARINVQFTSTVYMSLAVNQYFENLSEEEIGDHEASDYTIGNEVLNDTYNDQDYMTTYFTNKLTSMKGNMEIQSVELQTINNHDFWVCSYTIYKESTDSETGETDTVDTGEGRIYFNMSDGIVYYILLNSSDGTLALVPDAVNTVESFEIGKKIKAILFLVWGVIAVLVAGALVLFRNLMRGVSEKPKETIGQTVVLQNLKNFVSKTGNYRKAQKLPSDDEAITQVVPLEQDKENTFDADHVMAQINELKKEFELRNTEYLQQTETETELQKQTENEISDDTEPEYPRNYFLERFNGIKTFFGNLFGKTKSHKISTNAADSSDKLTEPDDEVTDENRSENQELLDKLDHMLGRK